MSTPRIDPAEVRDLFDYADGHLYWRHDRGQRATRGSEAGSRRPDGSYVVVYGRQPYRRSRLVWAWHQAAWPQGLVKHANDNNGDDRIANLQDVSVHALRHAIKNSGHLPGARLINGLWTASISVDGESVYLGSFKAELEAHQAFQRAHAAAHGMQSPYYEMVYAYTDGIENGTGAKKC